jgi:uncharacterized protein YcgI (DUF1989 family)
VIKDFLYWSAETSTEKDRACAAADAIKRAGKIFKRSRRRLLSRRRSRDRRRSRSIDWKKSMSRWRRAGTEV